MQSLQREPVARAREFFRLMRPLVAADGLAMVVHGQPEDESQERVLQGLIREAQRVHARRTAGQATLHVHFAPGRAVETLRGHELTLVLPQGHDHGAAARRLCLLIALCVLLAVLLRR